MDKIQKIGFILWIILVIVSLYMIVNFNYEPTEVETPDKDITWERSFLYANTTENNVTKFCDVLHFEDAQVCLLQNGTETCENVDTQWVGVQNYCCPRTAEMIDEVYLSDKNITKYLWMYEIVEFCD